MYVVLIVKILLSVIYRENRTDVIVTSIPRYLLVGLTYMGKSCVYLVSVVQFVQHDACCARLGVDFTPESSETPWCWHGGSGV